MKKISRTAVRSAVKAYYQKAFTAEAFVAGKTRIPYAARVFDARELVALTDASLDFWLTAGRYADEFEKKFAAFLGVRHCLLVNSGSSANLLAVSALMSPLLKEKRLKPSDEVITTACGFPTTLNPVIQNGLIPVFVDVGLGDYNMDVGLLKKAIGRKTRAIVLAHTLGNPACMDKVMRLAREYDLWVIEDNCDALGSVYQGRLTGTFGHMATHSFFPAHHMTMGEGGAVVTNDPLLRKVLLSLRDWGRDCCCEPGHDNVCGRRFAQKFGELPFGYDHKYVYSHIGYNLKATEMQAAIGCAQLKKLPGFIAARRRNFGYLMKRLTPLRSYFVLPQGTQDAQPSWFGFPLLVKPGAPFSRAEIVAYLEERQIATRMLFGGNLTKQPAYKDVRYKIVGGLKNTDVVMNDLFWIGVYPGLTRPMLDYMVEVIADFIQSKQGV